MEWLVIDTLGWRGRTPTTYSFLHLLCYGLANCSATTICAASYLAVSLPCPDLVASLPCPALQAP